jgi:hypothetical protein
MEKHTVCEQLEMHFSVAYNINLVLTVSRPLVACAINMSIYNALDSKTMHSSPERLW